MKKYKLILILQILCFAGCNKDKHNVVNIDNGHVFEKITDVHDVHITIPDSIQIAEWATDGNSMLIYTDNSNCMFVLMSLDSIAISETFGKKGKGDGEFLMPHVLGDSENGYVIVDNGNKKIFNVRGTNLSEIRKTGELELLNQPRFIDRDIIGYQELSPSQLKLNIYNLPNGESTTIVGFPENGTTDNSDLYDFVWDSQDGKIVTAQLYADLFSIRETDADGNQSVVTHVKGDDNYSQDRIVYSDIACGDFIYLLCQTNVDIEEFTGNSVIEKYDYDGNPVSKYVYDGIIDKIILDQERNRMLFTSPSDEDIHYFEL